MPDPTTQQPAGTGHRNDGGRDTTERFLALLITHQRRVHGYILSLIPNRNDADDLLQETIVVLWRKFDTFEPGTDFVAWSLAIARLEVLRFRQKYARSKLVFNETLLESLATASIARSANLDDRLDALEVCMGKLTERDRELITLRYREGLTIKQVAGRVERPIAGMYKAMARVHAALSVCIHRALREETS